MEQLEYKPEKITFKNGDITVAGNLYNIPNSINNNVKYPAVIIGHPAGGVKEQEVCRIICKKTGRKRFYYISFRCIPPRRKRR
jgi:hypothetical protein